MRNGTRIGTTCVLVTAVAALLMQAGTLCAGRAVYKEAEIKVARANVVRHAYARKLLELLLQETNRWVQTPDARLCDLIRPVTPRGNATVCPIDGGTLECKMDDPWVLICRRCETKYPNDRYPDKGPGCKVDRKTCYFIGRANAHHIGVLTGVAHDLALAYALTGKIEYAYKSAVILTRIGEVYPGFARHDTSDGDGFDGGKVCPNTQAESGWLKVIVATYELLRDAHDPAGNAVINGDRKNVIENGLLRPTAELLMKVRYGMHSVQAAQNAAVAAVGVCLSEPKYVHYAVDGPFGFRNMLANGTLDDGLWHEGAMGLHTYTTSSLLQLAHYTADYSDPAGVAWSSRPDRYEKLNLEASPKLQRMIRVANRSAFPDGNVPALNDSRRQKRLDEGDAVGASHRLADQWGARMEWTPFRRMMHTPDYARMFRRTQTFEQLDAAPPASVAYDMSGFGLAVLRSDLTATCNLIALDHSLQLAERTHPDILQMLLMVEGVSVARDYGRMAGPRRPDSSRWAAHTVAHNTVVVDRANQSRNALARLVNLYVAGTLRTVEIDGGDAYPQCSTYRRAVLMVGRDYALDVFRVSGGTRHEYAFHADGDMTVHGLKRTRRLKKAVAKEPGFRELVDFQKGHTSGNVEVIWRDAKGLDGRTRGLRLIMLGDVGTTTVRFGPGYRSDENRPVNMILAQRNRGRSHFVSVLEPLSGLPKLKAARLLKSRWTPTADKPACVVEIDGDNWTDRIEYAPSSPNKPGRWSVTRLQQGRVRFLYCSNGAKSAGTGWVLKCAEPVLGKTGQVKFRRGTPEVLLDMPVTWGKASRGLDLLVGEPSGRLSRYRMENLTPIGNAAWASLRKDRGIQLSVMRAEETTLTEMFCREALSSRRASIRVVVAMYPVLTMVTLTIFSSLYIRDSRTL